MLMLKILFGIVAAVVLLVIAFVQANKKRFKKLADLPPGQYVNYRDPNGKRYRGLIILNRARDFDMLIKVEERNFWADYSDLTPA